MVLRTQIRNGLPVIKEYTIGGSAAITEGQLLILSNDTVVTAADQAVIATGWATGPKTAAEVVAGTTMNVMECNDNTVVEMRWIGTLPSNPLGDYYGLDVSTGVQTVNMDDVTNKLFKLIRVTRNGTATGHRAGDYRCLVCIPSTLSQSITES